MNWQTVNNGVAASHIETKENSDGSVAITVTLSSVKQTALEQKLVYTVNGDGAINVELSVDATKTTLGMDNNGYLRIGTYMLLPEGYENVEWYGLGPVETMLDRQTSALVGKYSSTVSELFYPYHDTQDTGTLNELRYITVTNPNSDVALAIAGENYFEGQALHFTADALTQARHPYELTPLNETVLTVNMQSRGTGNGSCGPGYLDKYLIQNDKEYTYSYTILPYDTSATDVMEATRNYRTSQISSEDEVILEENMSKINEVNSLIDQIVVNFETTVDELDAIKAKYNEIPEKFRSYVGEERLNKLNSSYELIGMLKNYPSSYIQVTDKSGNDYGVNVSLNPTEVKPGNGTIAGYKGGVGFKGAEIIKNSDGTDAQLNDVFGGTQPFTIDMVVNPANYNSEQNTVFGADIYLNDVSYTDWVKRSPTSWYDRAAMNKTAFVGNLDGDNHTIYGLYYNGTDIVGLFPQASNTTVSNLRISNAQITSSNHVAAIISFGQNSVTMEKCIVDETVKLTATSDAACIGGFVGWGTPKVYIYDSAVMASINSSITDGKGAFVGNIWNNTSADRVIKNSFSAIDIRLFGHPTQGFTAENVYNIGTEVQTITGTVTKLDNADMMKGTVAKTNMPGLDWKETWLANDNGYPVLRSLYDLGDLNGDGEINIVDVVRFKKILALIAESNGSSADIDQSGKVDALDLNMLREFLLGNITDL